MIPAPSQPAADRSPIAIGATLFFLVALVAAVILGPQLAIWTAAPAMLALALSLLLLVVTRPGSAAGALPWPVSLAAALALGWLGFRAATSPVAEFAVADGVLIAGCLGSFLVTRRLLAVRGALELLFAGLGLLVLANAVPLFLQARDPSYAALLPRGTISFPSGFFSYYGDAAAFLLGYSLLAGGLAWDDGRSKGFRVFMALTALAAAAEVLFTRSRGGIAGLGAGAAILLFVAPWLTAKKGSSRIAAFVLAVPVLVIGGILLVGGGLDNAQKARGIEGGSAASLLDNSARFLWSGIALSCIAGHPLQGGGSRSYSWESLQFWDAREAGYSPAKPEFVHNELLQLTTDYGLAGLLLVLVFLGTAIVCGIVGRWNGSAARARTPVFLGGLAALAGLLVHACLHFVFHLLPAALLLGVALAFLLDTARRDSPAPCRRRRMAAALPLLATALAAGFFSIRSIPAFLELAPLKYRMGGPPPGIAEAIDRLSNAARHWPTSQLHLERGLLLQSAAATSQVPESTLLFESAAAALGQSLELNPYHPEASVNRANTISMLARDDEAEQEFHRAIRLQGGMELGFMARFSASLHHSRKAERLRVAGRMEEALASLLLARDFYDASLYEPESNQHGAPGRTFRIALSQQLGTWLQALGRFEDAADEYGRASRMPHTWVLHFLAAGNLTAWGDKLWLDRQPEQALEKFTEARARLVKCSGHVPPGFTATDLQELTRKLESKIAFLEGAGIRLEEDGGSGGR